MKNKPSQNSNSSMVRDALSAPDKQRCTKCNAPFEAHHHKHITREGIFHTSCYGKQVEMEEDYCACDGMVLCAYHDKCGYKKGWIWRNPNGKPIDNSQWSLKVHDLLDEYGYGKGSKERSKLLALTARLYCFIIGKEK